MEITSHAMHDKLNKEYKKKWKHKDSDKHLNKGGASGA